MDANLLKLAVCDCVGRTVLHRLIFACCPTLDSAFCKALANLHETSSDWVALQVAIIIFNHAAHACVCHFVPILHAGVQAGYGVIAANGAFFAAKSPFAVFAARVRWC